jgi:hypothetical protein
MQYVLRDEDTCEYLRPRGGWHRDLSKARLFRNPGHARSSARHILSVRKTINRLAITSPDTIPLNTDLAIYPVQLELGEPIKL